MHYEIRKILSVFLFVTVIISCFGLISAGSVTASEISAKNTYGESFEVMKVITADNTAKIDIGKKEYIFSLSFAQKIEEYENYIFLTPLSPFYYFYKSLNTIAK